MDLKDRAYIMPTDELIDRLTVLFRGGMCLDLADVTGKRNKPGVSDDEKYIYEAADHALDRVDLDDLYSNAEKLEIPDKYPEFFEYLTSLQIEEDEELELESDEAEEEIEEEVEEAVEEEVSPGNKALYDIVNGQHTGKERDSEKWVEKDKKRQALTDEYNAMMAGSGSHGEETSGVVGGRAERGTAEDVPQRKPGTKTGKTGEKTGEKTGLIGSERGKGNANVTSSMHTGESNAGDVTHVIKGGTKTGGSGDKGVTPPLPAGTAKKSQHREPVPEQQAGIPEQPEEFSESPSGYVADSYALSGQEAEEYSPEDTLQPDKGKKNKKGKKKGKPESAVVSGKRSTATVETEPKSSVIKTGEQKAVNGADGSEAHVVSGKGTEKQGFTPVPPMPEKKQEHKKPETSYPEGYVPETKEWEVPEPVRNTEYQQPEEVIPIPEADDILHPSQSTSPKKTAKPASKKVSRSHTAVVSGKDKHIVSSSEDKAGLVSGKNSRETVGKGESPNLISGKEKVEEEGSKKTEKEPPAPLPRPQAVQKQKAVNPSSPEAWTEAAMEPMEPLPEPKPEPEQKPAPAADHVVEGNVLTEEGWVPETAYAPQEEFTDVKSTVEPKIKPGKDSKTKKKTTGSTLITGKEKAGFVGGKEKSTLVSGKDKRDTVGRGESPSLISGKERQHEVETDEKIIGGRSVGTEEKEKHTPPVVPTMKKPQKPRNVPESGEAVPEAAGEVPETAEAVPETGETAPENKGPGIEGVWTMPEDEPVPVSTEEGGVSSGRGWIPEPAYAPGTEPVLGPKKETPHEDKKVSGKKPESTLITGKEHADLVGEKDKADLVTGKDRHETVERGDSPSLITGHDRLHDMKSEEVIAGKNYGKEEKSEQQNVQPVPKKPQKPKKTEEKKEPETGSETRPETKTETGQATRPEERAETFSSAAGGTSPEQKEYRQDSIPYPGPAQNTNAGDNPLVSGNDRFDNPGYVSGTHETGKNMPGISEAVQRVIIGRRMAEEGISGMEPQQSGAQNGSTPQNANEAPQPYIAKENGEAESAGSNLITGKNYVSEDSGISIAPEQETEAPMPSQREMDEEIRNSYSLWEAARGKAEMPTDAPLPDTATANIGTEAVREGNRVTVRVDGKELSFMVLADGTINMFGNILNVYGDSGQVFVGYKNAVLHDGQVEAPNGMKFALDENGKAGIEGCPGLYLAAEKQEEQRIDVVAPGRRNGDRITVKVNGTVKTFTLRPDGTIFVNGALANVYTEDDIGKVRVGWKGVAVRDGEAVAPDGKTFHIGEDGKTIEDNHTGLELETVDGLDLKETGSTRWFYSGPKQNEPIEFQQEGNSFLVQGLGALAFTFVNRAKKEEESVWKPEQGAGGTGSTEGNAPNFDTGASQPSGTPDQETDKSGTGPGGTSDGTGKTSPGGTDRTSGGTGPGGASSGGTGGKSPGGSSPGGGAPPGGTPPGGTSGKDNGNKTVGKENTVVDGGKSSDEKISRSEIDRLLRSNQITRTMYRQGRIMHVMMGNDVIKDMYNVNLSQENIQTIVGHYDDILSANCENPKQFAQMNAMLEDKYLTDEEKEALRNAEQKLRELGLTPDTAKLKKKLEGGKLTREQQQAAGEYINLYEKTRERIIKDGVLIFSEKNKDSRIEHTFFASSMLVLLKESGLPTDEKTLKKMMKSGNLTEEQKKIAQNAITAQRSLELFDMAKRGVHTTVQTASSVANKTKAYAEKYMGRDYTMRGLLLTTAAVGAVAKAPIKAWKTVKKARAIEKAAVKTIEKAGQTVSKVTKAGVRTAKKAKKTATQVTKVLRTRDKTKVKKAASKATKKFVQAAAKTAVTAVKTVAKVIAKLLVMLMTALASILGPVVVAVLIVVILIFGATALVSNSGDEVYYDAGDEDTTQVIQEMVDVLTLCNYTFRQNLESQFGAAGTETVSTDGTDTDASGEDESGYPHMEKGDSSDVQGKYNVTSGSWWNWEFAFNQEDYHPDSTQHVLHQKIVSGEISKSNNGGYLFLNNQMYAAAFTAYWGKVGDVLKVEFDREFTIGTQPATNIMYILIVDTKAYIHTGYPSQKEGLYGHINSATPGGTTRDFAEFTTYDDVTDTDPINLNGRGLMPVKATNMGNILDGTCDMATIGSATSSSTHGNGTVYYQQIIDQDVYREIIDRKNNIFYTFPEVEEVPEGIGFSAMPTPTPDPSSTPTPSPTPAATVTSTPAASEDEDGEIYAFYNNDQELISMVLAMFDFDINSTTNVKRNTILTQDKSGVNDNANDTIESDMTNKINYDTWRLITYFDENGLDLTNYQEGGYDELRYSALTALYNASHIVTWNQVKKYHNGPDGTFNPVSDASGRIIGQNNTDGMSQRVAAYENTTEEVTKEDGTTVTVPTTKLKTDASGEVVYETHYAPCPGHISNVATVTTLHFDALLDIQKWWIDNIYSDNFETENPEYTSDDPSAENYKAKEKVLKSGFQYIKKPDYYMGIDGTCSVSASSGSVFNGGVMTETQAEVAQTCYDYITGTMGLTSEQALGILANMWRECEFDYTEDEDGKPGGTDGYGLIQWTDTRRVALIEWCTAHPDSGNYNTLEGQLAFLKEEFTNPAYISEAWTNSVAGFKACTTAVDAGVYFVRYFERPLAEYMYDRINDMADDINTVKTYLHDL